MPIIQSTRDQIVKRLRWVMTGATAPYFHQHAVWPAPGSYWLRPETVHEANALSRFFLAQGWRAFALYYLIYLGGMFLLLGEPARRV